MTYATKCKEYTLKNGKDGQGDFVSVHRIIYRMCECKKNKKRFVCVFFPPPISTLLLDPSHTLG